MVCIHVPIHMSVYIATMLPIILIIWIGICPVCISSLWLNPRVNDMIAISLINSRQRRDVRMWFRLHVQVSDHLQVPQLGHLQVPQLGHLQVPQLGARHLTGFTFPRVLLAPLWVLAPRGKSLSNLPSYYFSILPGLLSITFLAMAVLVCYSMSVK